MLSFTFVPLYLLLLCDDSLAWFLYLGPTDFVEGGINDLLQVFSSFDEILGFVV